MKTFMLNKADVEHKWFVVDASAAPLGRLAAQIAPVLMGKNKVTYTPGVDCGDCVIVLNAEKLVLNGDKAEYKEYDHYTGFPGGHKHISFKVMLETKPERVVEMAVKRMLPKNKLGRNMMLRLKVYKGNEHEHSAQQPEKLEIK